MSEKVHTSSNLSKALNADVKVKFTSLDITAGHPLWMSALSV